MSQTFSSFNQSQRSYDFTYWRETISLWCMQQAFPSPTLFWKTQNHPHWASRVEQWYVCDVCGKPLPDAARLKWHMFVHTGEQPFACDLCGKRLSDPGNLKRHKLSHTGQKWYVCNTCGKGSTTLKINQRSHTGEKPYLWYLWARLHLPCLRQETQDDSPVISTSFKTAEHWAKVTCLQLLW